MNQSFRKPVKLVIDQLSGVNIRPVELEMYTKCVQTDLTLEGVLHLHVNLILLLWLHLRFFSERRGRGNGCYAI